MTIHRQSPRLNQTETPVDAGPAEPAPAVDPTDPTPPDPEESTQQTMPDPPEEEDIASASARSEEEDEGTLAEERDEGGQSGQEEEDDASAGGPTTEGADDADVDGERDLDEQGLRLADTLLVGVYGDSLHRNGGTHLHGGIGDDEEWQRMHRAVCAHPHRMYEPPKGKVGLRFVSQLAKEFEGVRARKHNSERPLIFPAVILFRNPRITKSCDIRRRIERRLDLWDEGHYSALVADCVEEALRNSGSGKSAGFDAKARRYNNLVVEGKLRQAVRGVTDRNGGGILLPEDHCTKETSKTVREVLESKHPHLRIPDVQDPDCACFEEYADGAPEAIPVDSSADGVASVAPKLHGGAGPSSVDAMALRCWLVRFGRSSSELREEMAQWVDWLANYDPPWAAYRAMMARRLVALDKRPGTRPVGIGEVWQRLLAKCVLAEVGEQGKSACGSTQLCAGLEAGIEGSLHAVRKTAALAAAADVDFWAGDSSQRSWNPAEGMEEMEEGEVDEVEAETQAAAAAAVATLGELTDAVNARDDGVGLTLVDARNGFNELSRMAMLWTVRHRWPKGSRFAFNCYRHEAMLFMRSPGKPLTILWSREGVTQGDPLAMILYGIALLPLAEKLRAAYPDVMQPWYADDSGLFGRHARNARCLKLLTQLGPWFGYYPEPAKSWHICTEAEETAAREAFRREGFQMQFSRGKRYVGGFIGSEESRAEWLKGMVDGWVYGVRTLAAIAVKYPQTAYAGLASSLQGEWQYLCRTTPGVASALAPVEAAIREDFLPALFGGNRSIEITNDLRTLFGHSVKKGGLGLRNPSAVADGLFNASRAATSYLAECLVDGTELELGRHRRQVRESAAAVKSIRAVTEDQLLEKLGGDVKTKHMLETACEAGAWLTALPRRMNGTEMCDLEFRDALRLRYNFRPLGLETVCDGCGGKFSVDHAMSCKLGGLVSRRHEAVKQEFIHLGKLAFGQSRVTDEPKIFYGRGVRTPAGATAAALRGGGDGGTAGMEARGDIAIDGFWKSSMTAVFDVRVADPNARTYRGRSPASVLQQAEREKVRKYAEPCRAVRRHFTPLVYSVAGMPGKETRAAEKRLASALAAKLDRQYSEMAAWVRQRMCLAVARQATILLRGSRTPRLLGARPVVLDGAALNDFDGLYE